MRLYAFAAAEQKINYCHDGCCENSLISDFIVLINMDCIICTVTHGYNV